MNVKDKKCTDGKEGGMGLSHQSGLEHWNDNGMRSECSETYLYIKTLKSAIILNQ